MADTFRWQALFQRSREPLFVLDRRRRVVFANRASETLTGLALAEIRGLRCTRRAGGGEHASLGHTLAPPAFVLQGRSARIHRPVPRASTGPPWWELEFLPLLGDDGLLAILVTVRPDKRSASPTARAISEPEAALRDRAAERVRLESLDGRFPAMKTIASQARLAVATHCPVKIVGESGAGKEWLARAIHCAGPDMGRPFLALDAAHLPTAAVNGVLFGPLGLYRTDGAGTIYIAEPSRLTLDVQDELAQRLANAESGGPRIIAGTVEASAAAMLPALSDALSVLAIGLPPLRERGDDWPGMVAVALERLGASSMTLSTEAFECVRGYAWPRNWDELMGVLDQAAKCTRTGQIDVADLPLQLRQVRAAADSPHRPAEEMPKLDAALEDLERRLIVEALAKANGNQSKAAELLQIWRPRLIRRIKALGIKSP